MSTSTAYESVESEPRRRILDTVDRVCELCFGLFMALTFIGAVKAVNAGEDAGHKMFVAALGCNLAWGLADAVMYLVRTLAERGQRLRLAHTLASGNRSMAMRALRDALPVALQSVVQDADLERLCTRLGGLSFPHRARLGREDLLGAVGIFLLVVMGTFPVAVPFLVLDNVTAALVASRVLTLSMLFSAGFSLGRYTGGGAMKAGFAMVALGVLLTVAIIALGG